MLHNDSATKHSPIQHPYHTRWLNGNEYEEILLNQHSYTKDLGFPLVQEHPEEIYYRPSNGFMYFLKKQSLRNLGFPRLKDNTRKVFKWKKMNFQTPLPKHDPKICYIVCSTTTSSQENTHYRMHIVQLYNKRDQEGVLLCHVLQIQGGVSHKSVYLNHLVDDNLEEEIRNCKERLEHIMWKSSSIQNEILFIQLKHSLLDDDLNYIREKLIGTQQLEDEEEIYCQIMRNYQIFMNEFHDGEEVIRRYDQM